LERPTEKIKSNLTAGERRLTPINSFQQNALLAV